MAVTLANMNIETSTIFELKEKIESCREIKVHRKGSMEYDHHMLVTRADEHQCEIIHYGPARAVDDFKYKTSAIISQFKLVYDEYDTSNDVKQLFNFANGDKVIIIHRNDYPKAEYIEEVIKRAKSELSKGKYYIHTNSSEAFINWVFNGENVSKQILNSRVPKPAVADATAIGPVIPYTKELECPLMETKEITSDVRKHIVRGTTAGSVANVSQNVAAESARTASKHMTKEVIITASVGQLIGKGTTEVFSRKAFQNLAAGEAITSNVGTNLGQGTSKVIVGKVSQNVGTASTHMAKEMTTDVGKHIGKGTTEIMVETVPEYLGAGIAKNTYGSIAKDMTSDVSKHIGKETTEIIVENAASETSKTASKNIAKQITGVCKHIEEGTATIKSTSKTIIPKKAEGAASSITGKFPKSTTAETIEQNITKAGVITACTIEAAFLTKRIYDISHDNNQTQRERGRSIVKEVGKSVGSVPASVIGAAISQALIPIPIVGGLIGGTIGSIICGIADGAAICVAYDQITS